MFFCKDIFGEFSIALTVKGLEGLLDKFNFLETDNFQIIPSVWFEPFDVAQAIEVSAPYLVILRGTKDLGPAQPGHGSARCFALLSMTILLNVYPSLSFLSSFDPFRGFIDLIRVHLFRMRTLYG